MQTSDRSLSESPASAGVDPSSNHKSNAAITPQGFSTSALPTVGIVVVAVYVAAQILSDIGSLKIATIAGFSVDAGTFIYPITFTIRDLIHKRLGKQAARTVIVLTAGINLFMAFYFQLIARLPQDPDWGQGPAFTAILGPVWRIVAASILAEIVSELLDTEVYHWWVTKITRRHQWLRVLASNGVSIPVDSLIFCWVAFGGVLPNSVVWSIFTANVIVKGLVTLISLPGIYLVKEK
jgi:uncharacterized integral membrane protein (TIGR00697 family)